MQVSGERGQPPAHRSPLTALMADAKEKEEQDNDARHAEQPEDDEAHYSLPSLRLPGVPTATRSWGRRSRLRWWVKVIGSPDAIQPPMTPPMRPSRSARAVASALLRVAMARSGSDAAAAVHAGMLDNPPYQP